MADFTYSHAPNPGIKKVPRVKITSFGDGYEQRSADGLNTIKQIWTLSFNGLPTATADAIEAFFESKGGYLPFSWVNPSGDEINVTCKEWERNYYSHTLSNMMAVFEQYFGA